LKVPLMVVEPVMASVVPVAFWKIVLPMSVVEAAKSVLRALS
jgi:hypothetical protein